MASRAVFGLVRALARPSSPQLAAVETFAFALATGEVARLAHKDARAVALLSLLEDASAAQVPVLVELDDSSEIAEVHVSLPADRVSSIAPLGSDGEAVELTLSQTRLRLTRTRPDFAVLRSKLAAALTSGARIFVTTDEDGDIVHVEDTGVPFVLRKARVEAELDAELREARSPVSPDEARTLFARVAATSCAPLTPAGACITFLFPDDGCYARAHEMCRLIGPTKTGKAWIYGNLLAKTRNNPDCSVHWRCHVAPTIPVKSGANVTTHVIDPSLFTAPVPLATWKGVQGDGAASVVETSSEPYYRSSDGSIQNDPDYAETKTALATFRLKLKERSAKKGPPPYANCPVLAPNAEASV